MQLHTAKLVDGVVHIRWATWATAGKSGAADPPPSPLFSVEILGKTLELRSASFV
jgi:hypothetical protein